MSQIVRVQELWQMFELERLSRMVRVQGICNELTLILFALADEDDPGAFKMGRVPSSARKFDARAELFRRRLNACTKGLLEPSDHRNQVNPFTVVQYLHKTVRKFIERDDIFHELQRASNASFNPNFRLCQAYIIKLKMTSPEGPNEERLAADALSAMEYALVADPDCSVCQEVLLDELDKAAGELSAVKMADGGSMLTKARVQHWAQFDPVYGYCSTFLHMAVQGRLVFYVKRKLEAIAIGSAEGQKDLKELATELLHLAVAYHDAPLVFLVNGQSCSELISLLQHGADPLAKVKPYRSRLAMKKTILEIASTESENLHPLLQSHCEKSLPKSGTPRNRIFSFFRKRHP
jgi:hypothetical protein